MKKKYKYGCDGGCILLGNATSRVNLPNGYGDGEHTIEVRSSAYRDYTYERKFEWLGVVEGSEVNVYNYDCLHGDELTDKENILYTLPSGRWGVYAADGDILLQQWD